MMVKIDKCLGYVFGRGSTAFTSEETTKGEVR
jgi:hypothetical protein